MYVLTVAFIIKVRNQGCNNFYLFLMNSTDKLAGGGACQGPTACCIVCSPWGVFLNFCTFLAPGTGMTEDKLQEKAKKWQQLQTKRWIFPKSKHYLLIQMLCSLLISQVLRNLSDYAQFFPLFFSTDTGYMCVFFTVTVIWPLLLCFSRPWLCRRKSTLHYYFFVVWMFPS